LDTLAHVLEIGVDSGAGALGSCIQPVPESESEPTPGVGAVKVYPRGSRVESGVGKQHCDTLHFGSWPPLRCLPRNFPRLLRRESPVFLYSDTGGSQASLPALVSTPHQKRVAFKRPVEKLRIQ